MTGSLVPRGLPRDGHVPPFFLQYLGFSDTSARREYALVARLGETMREYTVWIEQAAFARGKAMRQDGPDICFQRLRRELELLGLAGNESIGLTDAELASYRDAHAPKRKLLGL